MNQSNMRLIFSICLAFLAATSVQSWNPQVLSSANCNDWMSKMLTYLRPKVIEKNADPASIPDMNLQFNYTFLFTDHVGWLNLSDIVAIGLSTIKRDGDCSVEYDFNMLLLKLDLLVDDMTIDAHHSTHVMGMDPTGNLLASLKGVKIQVQILIDLELSTVSLQHFEVPEVKDMKISMDGLGILGDALLAVVLAVVDNLFKNQVIGSVVDVIRKTVEDALEGIHFLPPIPTTTVSPPYQFNLNSLY